MLEVCEVFTSLMGEGPCVGALCRFTRFSRCSLRCTFCDTRYAWKDGKRFSVQKLASKVLNGLSGKEIIVLTGGEPLLQDHDALSSLCKVLRSKGFKILVETNGTIAPAKKLMKTVDIWSVSPKLENSGQKVVYKNFGWLKGAKDWYLKFVICAPRKDVPDVEKFLTQHHLPNSRVFLQPANEPGVDYLKRSRKLAGYVLKNKIPFKVVPQLHVLLGLK